MEHLKGINRLMDGDQQVGKFDVVSNSDKTPTIVLSKQFVGDRTVHLEPIPNTSTSGVLGERIEFKIILK